MTQGGSWGCDKTSELACRLHLRKFYSWNLSKTESSWQIQIGNSSCSPTEIENLSWMQWLVRGRFYIATYLGWQLTMLCLPVTSLFWSQYVPNWPIFLIEILKSVMACQERRQYVGWATVQIFCAITTTRFYVWKLLHLETVLMCKSTLRSWLHAANKEPHPHGTHWICWQCAIVFSIREQLLSALNSTKKKICGAKIFPHIGSSHVCRACYLWNGTNFRVLTINN